MVSLCPWVQASDGSSGSLPEKIFLQTDREVYIAGESLFYKIDLADTSGLSGQLVYLVLRNTRNRVIEHALVRVRSGKAWGNIYLPDTLSTGRYQVVAYTNVMRNYGPECFAAKDIFIANRFDKDLKGVGRYTGGKTDRAPGDILPAEKNIPERTVRELMVTTGKKQYGNREKITLRINYLPADNDTLVSVSVSVAEAPSRLPVETGRAEEKGRNDRYDAGGDDRRKDTGHEPYLPEYDGFILRGKVMGDDGKAAPDVYVMLSVPDSLVNMDYAVTDSTGMFRFLLNDFYFGKKIILTPGELSPTGRYKIVIEDKFEIPQPCPPVPFSFPPGIREYLFRCQDIVGIQKIYGQNFVLAGKKRDEKKGVRSLVYSRPSLTVLPEDYTFLKDLPEISKEIIPFLRIRKKNERYEIRVLNVPKQIFFKENAAMFLDGVPVDDFRQLLPLNSGQVKRIEVVGKQWFYGDIRFPGILAVFTRNQAIGSYHFSPGVRVVEMENLAGPSAMIQPRYDASYTENASFPDLRQVLCWIPDLVLSKGGKKEISFFSSDLSGSYIVKVTGVTQKGNSIVTTTRFVVNPGKKENVAGEKKGGGR